MAVNIVRDIVVDRHARVAFRKDVDQLWKADRPRRLFVIDGLELRLEAL